MTRKELYLSFCLVSSFANHQPFALSFEKVEPKLEIEMVIPTSEKNLEIKWNLTAEDQGPNTPPKPTGS